MEHRTQDALCARYLKLGVHRAGRKWLEGARDIAEWRYDLWSRRITLADHRAMAWTWRK